VLRIQGRTRFLVGKLFEAVGGIAVWVGIQPARCRIARELRRKVLPGCRSARLDASRALGIRLFQGRESVPEPERIGRPDGKDSNTALGTAWAAQQMGAASDGGIGEGAIDQGDKALVLVSELCSWLVQVPLVRAWKTAHGFMVASF
jgi:hypothetical protein